MKKILAIFAITSSIFASNIGLQLTNKTLFIEGDVNIPQNPQFSIRGGYLIHKDKKNFEYAGVKVSGSTIGVNIPMIFSMGVDFVKTYKNSAIPLNIGLSSYIPYTQFPIFTRAEISYAPAILSFQKADKFFKVKAEIGATPIENAEIFIGYRNINFTKNYNSNLYIGAGFVF